MCISSGPNLEPTHGILGFEVQDAVSGGRHTLMLSGELDLVSSGALEATVLPLCAEGITGITLDLRKLTFMDCTGLRAVLCVKELADRHGYEFLLVPGPPSIQRLFEVTGLQHRLPFRARVAYPRRRMQPRPRRVLSARAAPRPRW
jgi:anti-sigma B factor antagonist